MKLIEVTKRHPVIAATTMLAVGAASIEIFGLLDNRNSAAPARSCVSPTAVSEAYVDSATNVLFQTDTGFFTSGVKAQGTLPEGAYGVEASFEKPGTGRKA